MVAIKAGEIGKSDMGVCLVSVVQNSSKCLIFG